MQLSKLHDDDNYARDYDNIAAFAGTNSPPPLSHRTELEYEPPLGMLPSLAQGQHGRQWTKRRASRRARALVGRLGCSLRTTTRGWAKGRGVCAHGNRSNADAAESGGLR